MTRKIDLLILEGSEYDMGYQQGKQYKQEIKKLYYELTHAEDLLSAKPFFIPTSLLISLMNSFTSNMIMKPIKIHLPGQWEFLTGISDGSGMSIKQLLFLQSIDALGTKIRNYKIIEGTKLFDGCSAAGIIPDRSETGGILMIKNWDGPDMIEKSIIFRKLKPLNGKYSTIGSGVDGFVGINNGMNEKGLSIAFNYAYPINIGKKGIPPMFIIREALEQCETVVEAISIFEKLPRFGGSTIIMGDKSGDLAVLESNPDYIQVRRKGVEDEKDFLICTNHYITKKMQQEEVPRDAVYDEKAPFSMQGEPVHKTSILRYDNAFQIFKNEAPPKISLDYLNKQIQCSHGSGSKNEPSMYTFCNHGENVSTGFGVMFDIENGDFYAIYGNPCQGEMQKLT